MTAFHGNPQTDNDRPPRTVHVVGLAVRIARRHRFHLGLATGRYWAWGIDRGDCTGIRLPFLDLAVVHLPGQARIRATYMGWRGINHAPDPECREWRWSA